MPYDHLDDEVKRSNSGFLRLYDGMFPRTNEAIELVLEQLKARGFLYYGLTTAKVTGEVVTNLEVEDYFTVFSDPNTNHERIPKTYIVTKNKNDLALITLQL